MTDRMTIEFTDKESRQVHSALQRLGRALPGFDAHLEHSTLHIDNCPDVLLSLEGKLEDEADDDFKDRHDKAAATRAQNKVYDERHRLIEERESNDNGDDNDQEDACTGGQSTTEADTTARSFAAHYGDVEVKQGRGSFDIEIDGEVAMTWSPGREALTVMSKGGHPIVADLDSHLDLDAPHSVELSALRDGDESDTDNREPVASFRTTHKTVRNIEITLDDDADVELDRASNGGWLRCYSSDAVDALHEAADELHDKASAGSIVSDALSLLEDVESNENYTPLDEGYKVDDGDGVSYFETLEKAQSFADCVDGEVSKIGNGSGDSSNNRENDSSQEDACTGEQSTTETSSSSTQTSRKTHQNKRSETCPTIASWCDEHGPRSCCKRLRSKSKTSEAPCVRLATNLASPDTSWGGDSGSRSRSTNARMARPNETAEHGQTGNEGRPSPGATVFNTCKRSPMRSGKLEMIRGRSTGITSDRGSRPESMPNFPRKRGESGR